MNSESLLLWIHGTRMDLKQQHGDSAVSGMPLGHAFCDTDVDNDHFYNSYQSFLACAADGTRRVFVKVPHGSHVCFGGLSCTAALNNGRTRVNHAAPQVIVQV